MRGPDLRGDVLGGLDAYSGVPLPRRQDCDLVQELIDTREEICSVLGLIGYVMENLQSSRQH